MLLDVRRSGVLKLAETMLPGAQWRDPANIGQWIGQVPMEPWA
jgi:superoxide dismutase, Fe-Mn family